jgi:hypothetical protein
LIVGQAAFTRAQIESNSTSDNMLITYLKWFVSSIIVSAFLFGITSSVLVGMGGGVASVLAVAILSGAQWSIVTLVTLPAMSIPFAGWFSFSRVAPKTARSPGAFVVLEMTLSILVVMARFAFEAHSLWTLRLGEIANAYYVRTWITPTVAIVGSCLLVPSIRQRLLTQTIDAPRN